MKVFFWVYYSKYQGILLLTKIMTYLIDNFFRLYYTTLISSAVVIFFIFKRLICFVLFCFEEFSLNLTQVSIRFFILVYIGSVLMICFLLQRWFLGFFLQNYRFHQVPRFMQLEQQSLFVWTQPKLLFLKAESVLILQKNLISVNRSDTVTGKRVLEFMQN